MASKSASAIDQLEWQLERLKLINVESTEVTVGRGSYGRVIKVHVHGTLCAAKEIHSVLSEQISPREFEVTKRKFLSECIKASRVLHPNVVQMLGIYYPTPQAKLPWLVMELMETSLKRFLEEHSIEKVPFPVKLSILVDTAQGLEFLHSQDIIHRDLSSNNVLLTKHLVAKIADLGVAKAIEQNKTKTQTRAPGTPHFMPPEALLVRPHYDKPVDVFSLACVALHVMSHQWPEPEDLMQEGTMTARTEVHRREKYLQFCTEPSLKLLIQTCLHNMPKSRPTISDVCKKIKTIIDQQGTFATANQIELFDKIQQGEIKNQRLQERLSNTEASLSESKIHISQLEVQLEKQKDQIRSLQQQMEGVQIQSLQQHNKQKELSAQNQPCRVNESPWKHRHKHISLLKSQIPFAMSPTIQKKLEISSIRRHSFCYNDEASNSDSDEEVEQTYQAYDIAKELLETQRMSVRCLRVLDKDFRNKIIAANKTHDKPVLEEDQLNKILCNVDVLYTLNVELLLDLDDRVAKWNYIPKIGDIMAKYAHFYKISVDYSIKCKDAIKFMKDCYENNEEFREVVIKFESLPSCGNLSVSEHLWEITQGIACYKQIMQKYVDKCLSDDSDDLKDSQTALNLIKKCEKDVKKNIEQEEDFKKLLEIEKRLIGDEEEHLISPHRKFLLEGQLFSYPEKGHSNWHVFTFFLFSDFLLYASLRSPENKIYQVIRRVPLHGMWVTDWKDSYSAVKFGFKINSRFKSFRLGASTEEEKVKWIQALNNAISEHEEKLEKKSSTLMMSLQNTEEQYPPQWVPNYSVNQCMICKLRFNMVKRRHHCRSCGTIICSRCSHSSLHKHKYTNEERPRVCKLCYAEQKKRSNTVSHGSQKRPHLLKPKIGKNCEIQGYLDVKVNEDEWKKQWFEVAESTLYVFEKQEDISASNHIILTGCNLTCLPPTRWYISHPKNQYKPIALQAESATVAKKWKEVLEKAIKT